MRGLVMRIRLAQYAVCSVAFAGMVACNQQSQNNVEVVTTPVVKPVTPRDAGSPTKSGTPVKNTRPEQNKPKPALPAVPAAPVQPTPGESPVVPMDTPQQKPEPVRLPALGKRVSHVPVKGKYVALTFDDGPHPSLTPKALDILNRHGAKGTFFMLGQNAARYKSIVARAAAEGHELGVHTWSHIKMNSSSRAKVDSEVSRTQRVLADASGVTPRVMRPPYGATNKALVEHMYNRYGMASILWDVDTIDWRKPGVSKVISTAVNKAKPGSIILVHDIHATTLSALEGIVTGLQQRGFKLVTVSELMQIARQEEAEAATAPQVPAEPTVVPPVEPGPVDAEQPAGSESAPGATEGHMEPAGEPDPAIISQVEPAVQQIAPTEVVNEAQQIPQPVSPPLQPEDPHAASDAEPALNLEALDLN